VLSAAAGPPHPLELAAKALARPALATDGPDAWRDLSDDGRWAVVDVARGCGRCPDARFDRVDDLNDALTLGDQRMDHVAGPNLRRRLCGLPLTRTWPPSRSWVAMGRVFTSRTAHNQRSIRVSSAIVCSVMPLSWSVDDDASGRAGDAAGSGPLPYLQFVGGDTARRDGFTQRTIRPISRRIRGRHGPCGDARGGRDIASPHRSRHPS